MAMSDERQTDEEHYREIAQKVRELARQSWIDEVQAELRELADRIERMAECLRASRARRPRPGQTSKD
jgi:hypothetical protein